MKEIYYCWIPSNIIILFFQQKYVIIHRHGYVYFYPMKSPSFYLVTPTTWIWNRIDEEVRIDNSFQIKIYYRNWTISYSLALYSHRILHTYYLTASHFLRCYYSLQKLISHRNFSNILSGMSLTNLIGALRFCNY